MLPKSFSLIYPFYFIIFSEVKLFKEIMNLLKKNVITHQTKMMLRTYLQIWQEKLNWKTQLNRNKFLYYNSISFFNLLFLLYRAEKVDDITNDRIKGIPDFWLTILKNTSLISDMIQPHDEPILSHLTDVKVYLLEEPMVISKSIHYLFIIYLFIYILRGLLWNSTFLLMNGLPIQY